MYKLALFASNVYIDSVAVRYSTRQWSSISQWIATLVDTLGDNTNAVKSYEERYRGHANSRMDLAR